MSNLFRLGTVAILAAALVGVYLLSRDDDEPDPLAYNVYFGNFNAFANGEDDKLRALQAQYPDREQDLQQMRDYYRQYLDEYETLLNGLAVLEPPDDVKDEHDEFLDASRDILELGRPQLDELNQATDASQIEEIFTPDLAFNTALARQDAACVALRDIAQDHNIRVAILEPCGGGAQTVTPSPAASPVSS